MKKATKSKEYSELDETIRSKIPKYMYGGGDGKCLPIHNFILRRNKERPPSKEVRKGLDPLDFPLLVSTASFVLVDFVLVMFVCLFSA